MRLQFAISFSILMIGGRIVYAHTQNQLMEQRVISNQSSRYAKRISPTWTITPSSRITHTVTRTTVP